MDISLLLERRKAKHNKRVAIAPLLRLPPLLHVKGSHCSIVEDISLLHVKENLRVHPFAPLSIPHAAIKDCTINRFHIPKKSHVIVNVWAVGRDPSAWADPEKFIPERFVGSNIDLRGRDFQLLPFGSGRRGCPGMHLGPTVVHLVVAQLVHCFDWELPDTMLPTELDMTEEYGLTVPRAKHLLAIPTNRLRQQ